MKKTILLIGILLGAMMILTACTGNNGDDAAEPGIPTGDPNIVEAGDTISVEYAGFLSNGEMFDTSEGRAPLTFIAGAGMMIPGFDAAVLGMELGEEKTVEIPSELAYGEHGSMNQQTGEYVIPPNEDITFDIKVVDIQKAEIPAE